MTTIFMDESGYTREDLLSAEQPFFTLATLCCSEQECKEYVARFFNRVKAPESELKYNKLMRNGKQELILEFLREIAQTPKLVKISICDKQYELTKRIVQCLVGPAAKKAGIDIRIKGQDLALTYDLYHIIPGLAGKEFFDDLLRRFQNMMIYLDHESYDRFFDLLFDERYLKLSTEENQRMLDFYLNHIKVAHTTVGYSLIDQREAVAQSMGVPHSRPLDVAFPIAMMLMQEWRKDVSDGITLIHDKSSRMTEVMHMWNTIFHHHPPPALQQMYAGTRKSAMGLAGTSAQDSKDWRGIQLADILAGATRTWVHWLLGGRNPDDAFGTNLDTIMVLFQPIPNWPVAPVTPEYFVKAGLTEEEARAQDELGEKLTTFHRIRAGGYTYRVFPEENE